VGAALVPPSRDLSEAGIATAAAAAAAVAAIVAAPARTAAVVVEGGVLFGACCRWLLPGEYASEYEYEPFPAPRRSVPSSSSALRLLVLRALLLLLPPAMAALPEPPLGEGWWLWW
jgi:hypothetical protein